jgi:hypothetical protein
MKKILAILAITTITSGAFAASGTIEYQSIDGKSTTPTDQNNYSLSVKESINKNFVGDLGISQTSNKTSGADTLASTRTEAGITGSTSVYGVTPYVRTAIGQKFTSATNFTYYSVEPGVALPVGSTGVTAKVGYRFRNALSDANVYNDTTRTWRAGLSYDLTAKDTIGVRYDKMRGDTNQNIVAVNYTRGF